MAEELKRVESFSELRAGMIVVLRSCRFCGSSHRALLISCAKRRLFDPEGVHEGDGLSWQLQLLTQPRHHNSGGRPFGIGQLAVLEKRLYRVLDGLESHPQETTTKRERVRG